MAHPRMRPNGVAGTRRSLTFRFFGGNLTPLFSAIDASAAATPRPVPGHYPALL